MDWLRLDINTIGCRLSGLEVKCSRARLKALGSNLARRDRGCALSRSPTIGRNGRSVV
ncbi:unnamed protein product [Schistosoma haematobium]|nr:unnamed protein product [Schistosoma haematobium]